MIDVCTASDLVIKTTDGDHVRFKARTHDVVLIADNGTAALDVADVETVSQWLHQAAGEMGDD